MRATATNALSESTLWPRVLLLAVSMFLLVGSRIMLMMLKPIVAVMGRTHGVEGSAMGVLHAPIATVVLVPALVVAYGQLSRRLGRTGLTVVLSVGYVGGLVAAYALANAGIDGGHGFEAWLNFSNILMVHLWAITVDVFSTSTGKRVLGVIASGGTLAGVIYLAWLSSFLERVGVNLRLTLLGACAAVLLALVLTWVAAAMSPVHAATAEPPGERNGFGLLRHDAHVRRIASLVAVSYCVAWILGERVPGTLAEPWSPSDKISVRAMLLILQIGLLPLLLPRLSVLWTLLVAPALALVEVGLLLLLPASQSTLPVRMAGSIGSMWDTVAIVALFLSASRNAKYDGQIVLYLVAMSVGRLCGAIITGALAFLGAGSLWLTLAPLVPVGVWAWLAVDTARHLRELAPIKST